MAAGVDAYQRNRIVLGALTQLGYVYTVQVNNLSSSFTSTDSDVSKVLQGLATVIESRKVANGGDP